MIPEFPLPVPLPDSGFPVLPGSQSPSLALSETLLCSWLGLVGPSLLFPSSVFLTGPFCFLYAPSHISIQLK